VQSADGLGDAVVGVDFGTLNTVIAVARNRGVDVVCAAVFSYVGFFRPLVGVVSYIHHY
jgi:hypothetical protein